MINMIRCQKFGGYFGFGNIASGCGNSNQTLKK